MFSLVGVLLLLICALCFAAVADGKIKGSIRQNGRAFNPGDEKALAEIATPEQLARWQQQGLIEGTWGDAASFSAPPQSNSEELEPIATRIAESLGVERLAGEMALAFLTRFAEEAEDVGEQMEARVRTAQEGAVASSIDRDGAFAQRDEALRERDEFKAQLEAAQSAPGVSSLAPLKSLDSNVLGKLAKSEFDTVSKIKGASNEQLVAIDGIAEATVSKIRELLKPQSQ